MRRLLVTLLIVLGVLAVATLALVLASRRPAEVGLVDGRLRPCPDTPNCVCSEDQDDAHAIEPLRFTCTPDEARASLAAWIEEQPNAELVTADGDYLHAVWRTSLLGFRDDVELRIDREARAVHVRSASRVGHSDLGANLERVDAIRAGWTPPR